MPIERRVKSAMPAVASCVISTRGARKDTVRAISVPSTARGDDGEHGCDGVLGLERVGVDHEVVVCR